MEEVKQILLNQIKMLSQTNKEAASQEFKDADLIEKTSKAITHLSLAYRKYNQEDNVTSHLDQIMSNLNNQISLFNQPQDDEEAQGVG